MTCEIGDWNVESNTVHTWYEDQSADSFDQNQRHGKLESLSVFAILAVVAIATSHNLLL